MGCCSPVAPLRKLKFYIYTDGTYTHTQAPLWSRVPHSRVILTPFGLLQPWPPDRLVLVRRHGAEIIDFTPCAGCGAGPCIAGAAAELALLLPGCCAAAELLHCIDLSD